MVGAYHGGIYIIRAGRCKVADHNGEHFTGHFYDADDFMYDEEWGGLLE